jgi:hypothetical protein
MCPATASQKLDRNPRIHSRKGSFLKQIAENSNRFSQTFTGGIQINQTLESVEVDSI